MLGQTFCIASVYQLTATTIYQGERELTLNAYHVLYGTSDFAVSNVTALYDLCFDALRRQLPVDCEAFKAA